jgi:ATP-dependent Lon protease
MNRPRLLLEDSNPASVKDESGAARQQAMPDPQRAVPEDALVIVPVRNMVLFPGMIVPIAIGRESSIAAAQYAVKTERPIGILMQRDPQAQAPEADDLSPVGTIASILRYVTTADGTHHIICQGQQRFRVSDYLDGFYLHRGEHRTHRGAHRAGRP